MYLEEYKPEQESLKFMSWNNLFFDKDTHESPLAHYFLLDNLFTRHTRFVAEMARGMAKSTIVSHKLPLYIAMLGRYPNFGKVQNAVLISDTYDQAWTQLQSCIAYYNSSEKLQEFLSIVKTKEGMVLFENKKGDRMHISVRGSNQSFRGTNYEGIRPQLVIADDILSNEIMTNPETSRKLNQWWVGTVIPAMDVSHSKVVVIGTPMTDVDLIRSLMRSPEYHTVRFPIAKEFSTTPSKLLSNWKDRFTPEKIIGLYNESKSIGCEGDFFREYFLEINNEEMQIFKKDWFKSFSKKDLMRDRKKYNFFTSMDLAVSKKESSDRSVVMTIAVNSDGHIFIVDIACGRFNPSEVIEHLFKQVRAYRPIEVRAEKAALQQVLNHFIDAKMLKENTHFLLNPLVHNSTTKKEVRIIGLQPKMKTRMIHFPEDACQDEVLLLQKELLGQTRESNTTGHDDLCDTLANFLDDGFIFGGSDYAEEDDATFRFEHKDPSVF